MTMDNLMRTTCENPTPEKTTCPKLSLGGASDVSEPEELVDQPGE